MPTSTELERFHYYQGKNTKCDFNVFSLSRKTTTNSNHKIAFSTSCAPAWANKPKPPLYGLSLRKSPIKNYATLFGLGWVIKSDQTKLNSTKPNKSPTWRLFQSPTSTAILQNTIPYPCNSSSCPQARKPTETAHSFSFSIVTPLVNISAGFLDPQIFSSITSLSSTR